MNDEDNWKGRWRASVNRSLARSHVKPTHALALILFISLSLLMTAVDDCGWWGDGERLKNGEIEREERANTTLMMEIILLFTIMVIVACVCVCVWLTYGSVKKKPR